MAIYSGAHTEPPLPMAQSPSHMLESAMIDFRSNRFAEARAQLSALLTIDPQNAEALQGLGYIAAKEGDYARAADYLDQAVALLPPSLELRQQAGFVNKAAGRLDQALTHFIGCLTLAPRHLHAYSEIAALQTNSGKYDEALTTIDRAIALAPQAYPLHYNKGKILGALGRYQEELDAYRRAIAIKPDFVDAYVNAAVALRDMRHYDEALRLLKKAISLDPEHAGARTNRAQINLLLGNFEHGWREYEWRWRDGGQHHDVPGNVWLGTPAIAGKTLLVHSEQGLGDTLQFVRYVDRLIALGADVVLRVQKPLIPLLQGYPGLKSVIGEDEALGPYDYHIPIMSLPYALWAGFKEIPSPDAYLQADSREVQNWRRWLAQMARSETPSAMKKLKIGLAWSGSRIHPDDQNRSMQLAQWAPLLPLNCLLVSLQKDVRADDRGTLDTWPDILDAGPELNTFADTAALIANLDLVISVDTSVAHLAGALGTPIWVALPYAPDWRWQLARPDSPWYARARLFRQSERGDWAAVIGDIVRALDQFDKPIAGVSA
jgi:tetratricopeptide (TPR) repeat protein